LTSNKGIKTRKGQFRTFSEYSRFLLERERGGIPLKTKAPVRIALVYPNRYEVGMASLGFQTVTRLFNGHPEIRCERVFIPPPGLETEIRALESGEPLNRFSFIGVSLSYELDAIRFVRLLADAGIPPLASERGDAHPLILIGGVLGGLNPSPLLPFTDAILVGEGEGVIPAVADALFRFRSGPRCKRERLDAIAEIGGVFIPGRHSSVVRQAAEPLEGYPTFTPIVTPLSHFENLFVVELSRGCARGCYFCAGGKVYHPLRFHSRASVIDTVHRFNPGAKRVGLEGASLSDYPGLETLCQTLLEAEHEISFSSLRIDRITPELLEILQKGGVRSFTVAPEAGTERLRGLIRKAVPDAVLTESVRLLGRSKVETLKLYFLIGLPGETDADVRAVADLVREASGVFLDSPKRKIRLSVNAFVPKPFTEFQWAAMDDEASLARKRGIIAGAVRSIPRVTFVQKSAREEILQGILSVGDERVGAAVYDRVVGGMPWKQAFRKNGIDPVKLIHEPRSFDTPLGWDFIRTGTPKRVLWERFVE
jgi:radical SAM superfamily enzyme YgiQ (UPF0313 family)